MNAIYVYSHAISLILQAAVSTFVLQSWISPFGAIYIVAPIVILGSLMIGRTSKD